MPVQDGDQEFSKGTKVQKRKIKSSQTLNIVSTSSTNNLINQASHLKNKRMNQIRKRKRDLLKRINYTHTFTVVVLPLLSIIYLYKYSQPILPENQDTFYFSCIYFNFTILAFNSGYHKYFAHNSFKIRFKVLLYYFAIFGSSIGLGSIRWWATMHRAHHHFTDDTEKDPYSIKRGFAWAHWGWLIKKPKIVTFYQEFMEQEFPTSQKIVNEIGQNSDEYNRNEVFEYDIGLIDFLNWQDKSYFANFLLTTILIPGLITVYFCDDSLIHGIIYPGILRMFLCQQSLLATESLCHLKSIQVTIPSQPFNDKNSSHNCYNPLMSILTYGQCYQNYHHEFPHDYRSTSSLFAYDPTKWFIWSLEKLGLIEGLCITPNNLIVQLKIQQQQAVLNRMRSQLNWGTPISKLPLITPKDFKRIIGSSSNKDRIYIIIQNIIHDVTPFMEQHPGGVPLLKASHGKDATKAFFGGVYGHSTAAQNLLATMRIGVLDNGNDEEVWGRVVREEGDVEESNSSGQTKSYSTAEAA
ncbi:uncharacterized protein RJT21DRAFT_37628 [Scheffersomyces amazonensis]|uniref:uncharacterized protein n=1 Tax=Scheffersomyces amazonensis TaxID=1078765 RepID=UPI00315CE074